MYPHMFSSTVATSRARERRGATHMANGSAIDVAVIDGGGMRSCLRRSGAATPVATSAHAPVRMARLDGRKVRRIIWPSGDGRARPRGLFDKALDHARELVGLGVPLHAEREALVGRLDGLGQIVDLRPPGHAQALADLIDPLVVVGLRAVRLLARGPRGKRARLEAHVVVGVVEG